MRLSSALKLTLRAMIVSRSGSVAMVCANTKECVWHYVGTTCRQINDLEIPRTLYNSTGIINFPRAMVLTVTSRSPR